PKPGTRDPEPETRNSEPGTRNPKPETRNPEPGTRNPKPETRNPEPETWVRGLLAGSPMGGLIVEECLPKPETRNAKPGTRNPKQSPGTQGNILPRQNYLRKGILEFVFLSQFPFKCVNLYVEKRIS
ncbi:hypothetical protein T484DRAFT_1645882, partial [Baffinella frigidus]